jgi:hypothetical protein
MMVAGRSPANLHENRLRDMHEGVLAMASSSKPGVYEAFQESQT